MAPAVGKQVEALLPQPQPSCHDPIKTLMVKTLMMFQLCTPFLDDLDNIDDPYAKERDANSKEDDIILNGDTSALLYNHKK